MANVFAVKSGNWSDPTVWNTGALPTAADDVYSNTFTVTIDVSPTVLSISNRATTGVTAGGMFVATNGITLTCTGAGIVSGSTTCFASSLAVGASCSVVSNATGGAGINAVAHGINNGSSGTINITGNLFGNGLGSSGNSANYGANNASTGTINITGNVQAGPSGYGIGVFNASAGTINVTGTITAGTGAAGGANNSTGTLNHVGTAQASSAQPAIGPGSVSQITTLTGPLISSDGSGGTAAVSGVNPCVALRWFPADTALGTFEYRMRGQTVSGSPSVRPARQLFLTDAYGSGYPAATNVRSGTTYGPGSIYTGTAAIPPAGSVSLGVPVDNTTGTATFTQNDLANALTNALSTPSAITGISSALTSASAVTLNQQTNTLTTPGSIGERLKLASTVATTAQQLSDALSNE